MAALFLASATGSSSTYKEAEAYFSKYDLGNGNDKPFNWDSKTAGLPVLFAQMNSASSNFGNFSTWRDRAEQYFDAIVNHKGPAYMTSGVFDFFFFVIFLILL